MDHLISRAGLGANNSKLGEIMDHLRKQFFGGQFVREKTILTIKCENDGSLEGRTSIPERNPFCWHLNLSKHLKVYFHLSK